MDLLKSPAISRLPPEMLEHVFERLPLADRHVASLVCLQWRHILAQDHFVVESVLSVRPLTLDSEWSLARMKRPFRRIVINSEGLESGVIWERFSSRVRRLVSCGEIRESVLSLRVFMSVEAVNEIFGQRGVVRFSKLQELTYSPVWQRCHDVELLPRINVFAPSLHTLKIDCVNACCVELVRQLAPKLKRCVLRFFEKESFLAVMASANFDRLRELSIHALASGAESAPVEKILSGDVGEAFRRNLEKLDKLDVRDKVNMFPYVYHLMFNAAPNLTFLNVEGIEMHPLALHATNNLSKLKILQLMVSTTYQAWQSDIELNLPELESLLLFPKLMARAGNLPKLEKFALHNHSDHSGFLDHTAIDALKTFTTLKTLKLIHLRDIVFSEETLEVITNFQPTPQIILEDIWDNINVLHQIVNSYPALKVLRLIRCRFKAEEEDPAVGEQSDDSEWETVGQAESVGQTIEFYSLSRLAEMFPHCTVDVHESFFMKHIERGPRRLSRVDGGDGQGKC